MRRNEKQKIEECVSTLFEAHDEIKKYIKKGNYNTAMDLLGQCQESAIQVGTLIESREGEGFISVGFLEEYCEAVYRLYEGLIQDGDKKIKPPNATEAVKISESAESPGSSGTSKASSWDRLHKDMQKKLIRASNSVKNDVPERIEAVFLPYKASMWDSLESVWIAADNDPNCDAYVIPIPYYDKLPDGNFGQMHYEGNLYPDNVPVTRYDDYDFEGRQPDMVFIHNPYDEYNLVTSVHPFFYTKNLKRFTGKLVYIPYFLLEEISPGNTARIKTMDHFCTTSAVINADQVIVQSDSMKQIYVDVLTQAVGEDTRSLWESKIFGLGSPKVDRALKAAREEQPIPEHWRDILYRPDGTRKKAVLYNTSITALLKNKKTMSTKMRDVFKLFKNRRDEIAFIWRPHPLIPATIESMLPRLYEEYRQIVIDYQKEGWGIYDDTPDVNAAISVSDAYYGDGSSVIVLYRTSGKPIMVQNPKITEQKVYRPLLTEDYAKVGNKLYFIARDANIVYSLDPRTGKIDLIDSLPEKDVFSSRLGAKIVAYNDELIFLPMNADCIWRYNLKNRNWRRIGRKNISDSNKKGEIFQAVLNGDILFAIGANYPAIIKLNLKTDELVYIEEPYREIKKLREKTGDAYFRCDFVQRGDLLYLASCVGNLVLEFHMDTCAHRWIELGAADNRYSGIAWDGSNFWLSPRNNSVLLRWNGSDEIEEIYLSDDPNDIGIGFLGVVSVRDRIILPAASGRETISFLKENPDDMSRTDDHYTFYKCDDSGECIRQDTDGRLYISDAQGREQHIDCKLHENEINEFFSIQNVKNAENAEEDSLSKSHKQQIYHENHLVDDATLLRFLMQNLTEEERTEYVTCGAKIWEHMRN